MEMTIMGMFDEADAEAVVQALRAEGIELSKINVVDQEPDEGLGADEAKVGEPGLWEKLKSRTPPPRSGAQVGGPSRSGDR